MKRNNESLLSRLNNKEFSPMIIRRYTRWGSVLLVALITDNNLSDLDEKVSAFMDSKKDKDGFMPNDIQELRNVAGELTHYLAESYDKTEGVAVIWYVDKMTISSLYGDFMNHTACRIELYNLLTFMTGV